MGEARASSETIACGVERQHASVIRLIRRHQADFEGFGPLRFQIRKGKALRQGGNAKSTEYAMLNEHQAALLVSFMSNTPVVVKFKVALVAEFFRMRKELQRKEQGLWAEMQTLLAQETASEVRASFGSKLMHDRRKELPILINERIRLENLIQLPLLQ